MDELHCKQQVVDQVDYMIYELKMERKDCGCPDGASGRRPAHD